MGQCVNLANIDANVACAEFDNLAGIVDEIIYGYWDDVATWPELPSGTENAPMDLETAGAWSGNVVMKQGKSAFKLRYTDQTGVLTMTDQGEVGGESVLYQLDIIRARISKLILGFQNATRGRKLFFIVTDKNGISYLMGDQNNAALKVAADASTTGTTPTDRNGVPLRFTYSCPRNLVYTGDKVNILTPAPAA